VLRYGKIINVLESTHEKMGPSGEEKWGRRKKAVKESKWRFQLKERVSVGKKGQVKGATQRFLFKNSGMPGRTSARGKVRG